MNKGRILSINHSKIKGVSKTPIKSALLIEGIGLDQDAHAGVGLKQVSLLSIESIKKQKECAKVKKTDLLLGPGDFAENITTEGIELSALKIGDRLRLGQSAVIEISKIGKDCHKYCAIYYKIGDCIMPREGIFAKVLIGAQVAIGDNIEVMENV
ncbi:MAG: MOSC domain-containing protein [Candidatus Omnitrophota bacterium]|nr:MOSC domain-containing protein [Candidatus Omnitrophota bacterium]